MSIETAFRVRCEPCGKYLPTRLYPYPVTTDFRWADLHETFAAAYTEAVRRGWSAYPLICPNCAADLKEKVQRVEVRPDGGTPENSGRLPESGQGAE